MTNHRLAVGPHLSSPAAACEVDIISERNRAGLVSNGIKFSPVSTITFADGTVLTCEADDPRRVPSLVGSTDSWDFACDANEIPAETDGANLSVVDSYN